MFLNPSFRKDLVPLNPPIRNNTASLNIPIRKDLISLNMPIYKGSVSYNPPIPKDSVHLDLPIRKGPMFYSPQIRENSMSHNLALAQNRHMRNLHPSIVPLSLMQSLVAPADPSSGILRYSIDRYIPEDDYFDCDLYYIVRNAGVSQSFPNCFQCGRSKTICTKGPYRCGSKVNWPLLWVAMWQSRIRGPGKLCQSRPQLVF